MGTSLILDKIPHKVKGSIFDRSRYFLGAAFMVMGATTFIYCFTDIKYMPVYYGTALNLTAYYIIMIMYKHAFLTLLNGNKEYNDSLIVSSLASCFVFPLPMWCAVLYGNEVAIEAILIISDIVFFIMILIIIFGLFKTYKHIIFQTENYYSEDIEVKIGWIKTSIYLIICMGFIGVFAAFVYPKYTIIGYVFMVYSLGVYTYVYKKFFKFIIDISYKSFNKNSNEEEPDELYIIETEPIPMDELIPEDDTTQVNLTQINDETYLLIQKNINEWIQKGNFTKNDITINSVASEVYTNRTYLSNYINTTYKCSFKVWITRMRVEKAKELLIEDKKLNINEVARVVGCSSATSFNHLFKQVESVSPAKWRALQLNHEEKEI